jgi:glycolate oxidase iron-sulfur subunit
LNPADIPRHLAHTADRCVRCGLCLPHCPTYREARQEAESPRGRIALIQGWAEGGLDLSPRLLEHLDNCLECLACERACPTLVPFGDLMDQARAAHWRSAPAWRRIPHATWLGALANRAGATLAVGCGRLYRSSGLARLATWGGIHRWPGLVALHRLAIQCERLPRLPASPRAPPAAGERIGLFLGCIARTAQPGAIEASIRVLGGLGYAVEVPDDQTCCGALHRHNGLPEGADQRLRRNAAAFSGLTAVGLASACVAELGGHPPFGDTQEICRLLADREWPATVRLAPLPQRIAVQVPCSQRNRLGDEDAAFALLRHIPGIRLVPLSDNAFCCGAAGTYLLQRPVLSRALLAPKIASLAALEVPILVTTNTGCALHLAAGAREAGLEVEVLHPVELIDRQMRLG